jgi:hypothetical protein
MQLSKEAIVKAKLKRALQSKNILEKRRLVLELFEACNYNKREAYKIAETMGLKRALSRLASELELNQTIKKKRVELILITAKKNTNITSVKELAKMMKVEKEWFAPIKRELQELFQQRKEKEKEATRRAWEKAIIKCYGNISKAKETLGIKYDVGKKDFKRKGVDVKTAVKIGRLKLKNDLMFVLKMNESPNEKEMIKKTARVFNATEQAIKYWMKKFGITHATIKAYHAPFAVVPTGKIKTALRATKLHKGEAIKPSTRWKTLSFRLPSRKPL